MDLNYKKYFLFRVKITVLLITEDFHNADAAWNVTIFGLFL